jgi:TolB protein
MRAVSRLAAFSFAIALASSGCGGVGSAEDCKPATSTIAFDSYPNGNYDIFESHLINADGTGRRLLAQHGIDPAWSPDGCRIAFIRWPGSGSNELYVVNADGSDPRRLTQTPLLEEHSPAWSPDGERIVLGLYGEQGPTAAPEPTYYLDVLDSDGSDRHRLVPFQADEPSWSPDGDRIAFTRYLNDDTSDVYVVDADGSNLRRLTGRAGRSFGSYYPAWSPDGRRIAFVRHNIYVIDADGTGLRRLTTSPPDPESRGDFPFVWSPDGQRIAFVRRSDARGVDIYVVRADGSGLRRLTRSGEADEPAWSPDGRRIVFSQTVPAGDFDQADLYIVNADGSGLRRLTKTPHLEAEPVWSPQ